MATAGSKWDFQIKSGATVTAAGWTVVFDILKDGAVVETVTLNMPPGLPWGAVVRQIRNRVLQSRNNAVGTAEATDTTVHTVVDDTKTNW